MATQDPNIATQDPYNIQLPNGQQNVNGAGGNTPIPPPGSPGLPIPPAGMASGGGTNTPGSIPPPANTQMIQGNETPTVGSSPTEGVPPAAGAADMSTAALTKMMEDFGRAQGRSEADLASTEASDAAYWIPKIQAGGAGQLEYWKSRMRDKPGQGTNAAGAGGAGGGAGAVANQNWFGTTPGQGTDLYNLLMKRAGESLNIDPNDPVIQAQLQPEVAQMTRANTQNIAALAERAGSNANIGAEERAGSERVGQGAATLEGQLMGKELDARRQEIQNALSGAQGLLTSEQQMQLQDELAKLQLAQQQSQFEQNLGQQAYQFGTNSQLNAAGL